MICPWLNYCPWLAQLFEHVTTCHTITILGTLTLAFIVLKVVLRVICLVWKFVLRPAKNLRKFGSWAIVTGGTDGIGRAYCMELARQGFNVCVVSRTESKLKEVCKEIETNHKVKTKYVVADFSDLSVFDKIEKDISSIEAGVLVNNVGISYEYPDYFLNIPEDRLHQLININITATTLVTRMVLPGMVERKKGGAIINLSSASGATPMGLLTVYSATKSYVDYFSDGLQQEYGNKGIIVQSVMPLLVATKMSKIRRASFFIPNPAAYVRAALNKVGYEKRTAGYGPHIFQDWAMSLLPNWYRLRMLFGMHTSVRKRALRKKDQ